MNTKLKVFIKDHSLGKGWYAMFIDINPATDDSHIIDLAIARYPNATGIRIVREYPPKTRYAFDR